jgi:hypothetical protein
VHSAGSAHHSPFRPGWVAMQTYRFGLVRHSMRAGRSSRRHVVGRLSPFRLGGTALGEQEGREPDVTPAETGMRPSNLW